MAPDLAWVNMVVKILDATPALDQVLRLQFAVAGVPFTAVIESSANEAQLTLTGDFGPVPFTAQRSRMRHTVLRLGREPLGRVRLASGRVEIVQQRRFAAPTMATDVIAMLVEAVLDCWRDSAQLADLLAQSEAPAQHAA